MFGSLTRPLSSMSHIVRGQNLGAVGVQKAKLESLRKRLVAHGIDAYIVVSEDEHSSEYICDADRRRAFITGFSGSAGTAIISSKDALLFTDPRYHQQASYELTPDWTLYKHGLPGVKSWQEYLSTDLDMGARVGFDPRLMSVLDYRALADNVKRDLRLVPIDENLVDTVWGAHRPSKPANPVIIHDEKYAGESVASKFSRLQSAVGEESWGIVVSMLDEFAYMLNLRGSDIAYNPVFFGYLLVCTLKGDESATLFVDDAQLTDPVRAHLKEANVSIRPYMEIIATVKALRHTLETRGKTLVVPHKTSYAISSAAGLGNISVSRGPIIDMKAIKNETQIAGFRACHIRDGVAVVRYFAWLQSELLRGHSLTEYDAALQLERFRSEGDLFAGLSFDTISSTGPNASVIHYSPSATDSAVIDKNAVYLCDSGAQYYDGTTDVTRTVHFGTPTEEEKDAYTRVLQGVISIETAVFPSTASGYNIDSFARRALWQNGLDFGHGTGHGIGHFLNVHEGPQGIGTRIAYNDIKLRPGHIISNEPGFYKDGSFGIRIENVIVVQPAMTKYERQFFKFESLTVVPISTKLVDKTLLTPFELDWLNTYNGWVRDTLRPLLVDDPVALAYLEQETVKL